MSKVLDAEITSFLNELEALREKNPVDAVGQALEDMFDAQSAVEGKSLDEQSPAFQQARAAVAKATQAVKDATGDLAKTSNAIEQTNVAIQAVQAVAP